jgi:class 3 adenylate cyclase
MLAQVAFRAEEERSAIERSTIAFDDADDEVHGMLSRGDTGVMGQWLRVYGDTLRRLTEAEADWWRTQVQLPSLASGLSEVEMLEAAAEWGQEFASPMDQALLAIYHANQEHAWTENLLEEVEGALDRAGLWSKIATSPAICFLDITGYTRITEERGDRAAAELVTRLTTLVQQSADRHGGKVVKRLGDGVMLHFRDPRDAVVAALEMLEAVSTASMPPAHIGVDTGPVVFQGGDYVGRTVNVAARIAEHAAPGQVLVSGEVVDRVGRPEGRLSARAPPFSASTSLNPICSGIDECIDRDDPVVLDNVRSPGSAARSGRHPRPRETASRNQRSHTNTCDCKAWRSTGSARVITPLRTRPPTST